MRFIRFEDAEGETVGINSPDDIETIFADFSVSKHRGTRQIIEGSSIILRSGGRLFVRAQPAEVVDEIEAMSVSSEIE